MAIVGVDDSSLANTMQDYHVDDNAPSLNPRPAMNGMD